MHHALPNRSAEQPAACSCKICSTLNIRKLHDNEKQQHTNRKSTAGIPSGALSSAVDYHNATGDVPLAE
jgi:hypothetical protein